MDQLGTTQEDEHRGLLRPLKEARRRHADIAVTIADHEVRLLHGRHDNPDAGQIVLEDV